MFTGIIEGTGRVEEVIRGSDEARLIISSELFYGWDNIGGSIGIDGVSLTAVRVIEPKEHRDVSCSEEDGICSSCWMLEFDLASETLRKTTMGQIKVGDIVNLERCLMVGARLDGHFVLGHVDCTGKLVSIQEEASTRVYTFELPAEISDLVAPKGSVAINGVSLTVGSVYADSFSVYLIPHTLRVTNLGLLDVASAVNLEADCLSRYAKRILGHVVS